MSIVKVCTVNIVFRFGLQDGIKSKNRQYKDLEREMVKGNFEN